MNAEDTHINHHADAFPEPHKDASSENHTDISSEPHTDISSESRTDVSSEPHTDISSEPHTDISSEPHTDISSESHTDISSEQHTDVSSKNHTDISSEPHADVLPESHTDISSELIERLGVTNNTDSAPPRTLSEAEIQKLQKDTNTVTNFKQMKLEIEAQKNWDLFYKRNTTKFFKDRHWTKREFQEIIFGSNMSCDSRRVILEVGCGVGNFMFPLLEEVRDIFFYACDFSKRAVQFVKEHPRYDENRCRVFHCDVTEDTLTSHVPPESVSIATLIFVLSAIHPDKMVKVLSNIYRVLRPGGILLFRDYGLHDYAMLRFSAGHKLSENFYVRQDGTRAYYFSTDSLAAMATLAEFVIVRNEYVMRETVNKKEGLCVPRIFVQSKFIKPDKQLQMAKQRTENSLVSNVTCSR